MTRFLSTAALLLMAAACGTRTTRPTDTDPTQVSVQQTEQAPLPATEYVAIVTSKTSKVIPAAFAGRIDDLRIHPSQRVRKDEILAHQDTSEMKSKLKEAKMREKSARMSAGRSGAEAGAAQQELRNARKLLAVGYGTRMNILDAQTKISAAGAGAGADMANGEAAAATAEDIQNKIDHADIKAPFDGVVSQVRVKDGDSVPAGDPVARIFDPSDLIVRFAIPMTDKTRVTDGMKIQLKVPDQEAPIWAVVTQVFEEIEPPISYRIVEADIDDSKLRPGELGLSQIGRVTIASAATAAKPTTTKGKNP